MFIFTFLCVTEIKAYLFHKADVVFTHLSHLLQKQNGDSHLSDIKCTTLTYTFGEDYFKPCCRCIYKNDFLKTEEKSL